MKSLRKIKEEILTFTNEKIKQQLTLSIFLLLHLLSKVSSLREYCEKKNKHTNFVHIILNATCRNLCCKMHYKDVEQ
jgi:hypothetical protein